VALTLNSTDDVLSHPATGLFTSTNWSACGWVYLESDRNTNSVIVVRFSDNTATNFSGIALDTDGTSALITTQAGDSSSYGLSTGVWYHVAYVKSGSSHTMYVDGVSRATLTQAVGADGAGAALALGGNGASHTNARISAWKVWETALTGDQVVNEMRTIQPRVTTSMWGVFPLWDATFVTDISGSGHSLTAMGTYATADGPPVSWGGASIIGSWVQPAAAPATAFQPNAF